MATLFKQDMVKITIETHNLSIKYMGQNLNKFWSLLALSEFVS